MDMPVKKRVQCTTGLGTELYKSTPADLVRSSVAMHSDAFHHNLVNIFLPNHHVHVLREQQEPGVIVDQDLYIFSSF